MSVFFDLAAALSVGLLGWTIGTVQTAWALSAPTLFPEQGKPQLLLTHEAQA